ncbi:FimB/Mfa2 family fimbrial subunit [uncultured Rikenella sp.]|uniref:FimB/Mfa2 family fimbrial subunit n=1 Tax=uncultured Rikenella sp. TaxID=368003 RepID=UPI00272A9C92|nr:FimB/Mfa2 family fimbrial subunit [uncultured Rikenella sp.]
MRKILILAATVAAGMAGMSGCTLTEKLDVEINMKPTLLLEFPDNDRVRTLHAMVYDPQGVFQNILELEDGVAAKATGRDGETGKRVDTLLAGVPEGEYRVVCYANLEQAQLAELKPGVSTWEELAVTLDPNREYVGSDAVYHSVTTHTVRRGKPACACPALVPRYYQVQLTLQSDEDNPALVEEYSACLEGVPGTIDGAGTMHGGGENGCCFTPELTTDLANYRRTAEFQMNRFGDGDGVTLVLFKEGVRIARVPVIPTECGVDPESPEEVVLPVFIEIAIDKIFISIQDWNTVIVQNAGVGG